MPPVGYRGSLEQRFAEKFIKASDDECWEWFGATNDAGYGQIHKDGKIVYAHRVSYELATGEELPSDVVLLHECDNPPCVNPNHLKPGTHQDNVDDMYRKGRNNNVVGEHNGHSRLTAHQVRRIKQLLAQKTTERAIATELGVGHSTIHAISAGRTWRHVSI